MAANRAIEWLVHPDLDTDGYEHTVQLVEDGQWVIKHHRWLREPELSEEQRMEMLNQITAEMSRRDARARAMPK